MFELWLVAFIKTLLFEVPVIFILLRGRERKRLMAAFLVANGLSHPALWFLFPVFAPYWMWLFSAEISVVIVEGVLYRIILGQEVPLRQALYCSLLANAFSCCLGLLL